MTKYTDEFIRTTIRRLIHQKRELHAAELRYEDVQQRVEYALAGKSDPKSIAKVYDWIDSEKMELDNATDDYEAALEMWKEMTAGIAKGKKKEGSSAMKKRWAVLEIIDDYSVWGDAMTKYYDTKEQAIAAVEANIAGGVWDRFDHYVSTRGEERPLKASVNYSLVREDCNPESPVEGEHYHHGCYVATRTAEELAEEVEEEDQEP